MFSKYIHDTQPETINQLHMLDEWAQTHKTVICLNGGYSANIQRLVDVYFSSVENPYPWATFYEEHVALAGALTCACIVLPARVYDTARAMSDQTSVLKPAGWTDWEDAFATELNNYALAR